MKLAMVLIWLELASLNVDGVGEDVDGRVGDGEGVAEGEGVSNGDAVSEGEGVGDGGDTDESVGDVGVF